MHFNYIVILISSFYVITLSSSIAFLILQRSLAIIKTHASRNIPTDRNIHICHFHVLCVKQATERHFKISLTCILGRKHQNAESLKKKYEKVFGKGIDCLSNLESNRWPNEKKKKKIRLAFKTRRAGNLTSPSGSHSNTLEEFEIRMRSAFHSLSVHEQASKVTGLPEDRCYRHRTGR